MNELMYKDDRLIRLTVAFDNKGREYIAEKIVRDDSAKKTEGGSD